MKKLKIIVVNVVLFIYLFILLFHVVNFYFSLKCCQCNLIYKLITGNKIITYLKYFGKIYNINRLDVHYLFSDNYAEGLRPIENETAQKSIIIFGCSYAYGDHLNDRETFSARLGKLLPKYRIYNRAKCGWTTSHMLYLLENKDFSDIPKIKLVTYVFMSDHFVRNCYSYMNIFTYTPYYELSKSGTLQFQEYSLKYIQFPILYLVKQMYKDSVYNRLYPRKGYKEIELTKKILKNSKLEIDQKFPNAKFIILRYDKGKEESYNQMFEELEQEGIKVILLKDFSNENYITSVYQETDAHPNARAWEEITPLFVKYLQDRGYLKD